MAGVIHVGAWDGREYVDVPGPLLLVEPQKDAFARLAAQFADREDVALANVALGSARRGTVVMHRAVPDHSSSILRPQVVERWGIVFDGATEEVELTTLDTIVDGRRSWDVLRIDTQGYELEVLKGAKKTLQRVQRIELELHDPAVYEGAGSLEGVDRLLKKAGFARTSWITDKSWNNVCGTDDLGDAVYEKVRTKSTSTKRQSKPPTITAAARM